MKKNILIVSLLFLYSISFAQNDTIFATIDLKKMKDDRVFVDVNFKKHSSPIDTVVNFYFPISIPGAYEDLIYSKYINDFKVYNHQKNELEFSRRIINKRIFYEKTKTSVDIGRKRSKEDFYIPLEAEKITYYVDDAYDIGIPRYRNFIPEANVFEKNKVFLINWGAILGCFTGNEKSVYKINIIKPKELYGATALKKNDENDTLDIIFANNYTELIDKPILYSKADTTIFRIGDSEIEVSVFSENGYSYSKKISDIIKPFIKEASESYLKGIMPKKYVFMYYFTNSIGMGALEHKSSSVYFLSLPDTFAIKWNILDVTAHEFLHILTPLTVCSDKISNSKLYAPYTSKHLWMYEGITDYFSYLFLLKTKDFNPRWFLNNMERNYKDALKKVSMTKMSENVYKKRWNKKYELFYSKGTLTAFALDLEIYKLSNGQMRLFDIMMILKEKYKNKPFLDTKFINEFVILSKSRKIKDFFDKYIIGSQSLPVNEYIKCIGYEYKNTTDTVNYKSSRMFMYQFYKNNKLYVYKPKEEYYPDVKGGRKIEIVSINGNSDVMAHSSELFSLKEGDYVEYLYKNEKKKLKIKTFDVTNIIHKKRFVKVDNPTEKQKKTFFDFLNYKYDIE